MERGGGDDDDDDDECVCVYLDRMSGLCVSGGLRALRRAATLDSGYPVDCDDPGSLD